MPCWLYRKQPKSPLDKTKIKMWVFDDILDKYDEGVDIWREYLYSIMDSITASSKCRAMLPPVTTKDDFLSETFLTLDKIILSDKPRNKKISNMFAITRLMWVWQFGKLRKDASIVKPLDDIPERESDCYYGSDTISDRDIIYYSMMKNWLISQREYEISWYAYNPLYTTEDVAKMFNTSVTAIYAVKHKLKKIAKVFTWNED